METRPGVTTTEFWTSVLTALYFVLNSTGVVTDVPPRYSTIALAIVTALYGLSRGLAKKGVADDGVAKGLFATKKPS